MYLQGRFLDFELGGGGGAHLKKLRRAEGGAKIFGVFRVKNHDFMPKNHIFSNFRGPPPPPPPPPPGSAPDLYVLNEVYIVSISLWSKSEHWPTY